MHQISQQTGRGRSFFNSSLCTSVTNYCRTDILNCRSVVHYKSISTGQLVNSFEDRFTSSTDDRVVSFRGFFIEQADGTFNIYSQNKMTNEADIDATQPYNQGVEITFNEDNLPVIPVQFTIVGKDPIQFVFDTLEYTLTEATFNNNTPNDTADDFVIPFQSQTKH